MMYHEEPIYRDGAIVGATTSGAWGHRVGRSLGMGYVHNRDGVSRGLDRVRDMGSRDRLEALRGEGAALELL